MKTMSDLYTQSLLLFITVVCCLTPATDEMDRLHTSRTVEEAYLRHLPPLLFISKIPLTV